MKQFLLLVCVLLVACGGGTVDTAAPTFVDADSAPGIDAGLPAVSEVINQTNKDFVPPPTNYTANATISLDEKKAWIGKDLVKVWVWNERGSQQLILAEGTGASIAELKVNVQVNIVGPEDGGEVLMSVNGQRTKVLNEKEEQKIGNTYVFVSDIFLSAPQ
jgi:hypothetical protein